MQEVGLVRKIVSNKIAKKINPVSERPPITESSPIAMFDSGVGGLSVFQEFTRLMPHESVIYLADTARVPYGGRSAQEIIKINIEILNYLIGLGAKLIIIACGTSSAIAYPILKDKYKTPIIAMIEGGSSMAVSATRNKKIGVIATLGTINSKAYQIKIMELDKSVRVFGVACPLLVPLIEGGFAQSEETAKVLKDYLKPLIKEGVDTLILGCTHYPHVAKNIQAIMGAGVKLINPAEETAKRAKETLAKHMLTTIAKEPPKHRFLSTANANSFRELASRLLGRPIQAEEVVLVKGRFGR